MTTKKRKTTREQARREVDGPFLSTEQLAARWGMEQETLRNMRFRGVGPRYFKPSGKKNGRVRYKLRDVEAYEGKNMVWDSDDIKQMVADLQDRVSKLADWERGFVDNVSQTLGRGQALSNTKKASLEEIWLQAMGGGE